MRKIDLTEQHKLLLHDSLKAIFLFTTYAHERQGSNPRFPLFHRVALIKSLDGRKFNKVLLEDEQFPESVWNEFKMMAKKPNKRITQGIVKHILEKMRNEGEPNLIRLLREKTLLKAYTWLKGVKGIGPKLASFFLRDLWSFIGPWKNTATQDLYCVQPIDRWVQFWAKECWPQTKFPLLKDAPSDTRVENFAKKVIQVYFQNDIDPISFNKGAWFVGSHFDNLCFYFKVPEIDQINFKSCVINYFKADKILFSIKEFSSNYEQMKIFSI